MTTLYPGNEPEFYIPDEQLPDKHIVDIKLSPDGEYLSVTGANSLSYIYRRNPKTKPHGFYKLDWSCQHSRLAKSVVNFVGFGENELHCKLIVCPINETMIHQYEIQDDDSIVFRSALDISQFGYHCIHWFVCYTKLNYKTYESTVYIFIIGSHPIDNKGPEQLTPMAEYYANMSFISHGYNKLFNLEKFKYHKDQTPKLPTKDIFVNKHEHRIYLCSYDYSGVRKYSRNMYNLSDSKHYNSHNESLSSIVNDYPDDYLYFKDRWDKTQTMNYYAHRGIHYKMSPLTAIHSGYEISAMKTLGENYIFQEENDTETMLHWGDEKYKFTHIKTYRLHMAYNPAQRYWRNTDSKPTPGGRRIQCERYKNSEPISLVNFFALEASCTIKSYIVVHEKVKETKALRLGFIQFIPSETEKKELQVSRLQEIISYATTELQNIPIELVDIIKSYL